MAIASTTVNAVRTDSVVPYMIVEYSAEGIGADTTSSELIEFVLPSKTLERWSYRNTPNTTVSGEAYAINLVGISISCNSTNFDFNILNKNDITLLDTINEVVKYTGNNKLGSDQSLEDFIIRNRDDILTNKLYMFINNHDSIPTGTIRLELIYTAIQDRVLNE